MNFFFGRNNKPEVAEEDENEEENEEDLDQDEEEEQEQDVEVFIIASEGEKKAVLASFDTMRRESLFCDVAFICHGVLFRAHKVVLSSWSRWMRAFLCDSPEEEVLSLDIFTPDAFRAVLDYMYGHSLHLTMENADAIIKVVRRLELQKLEQQCWRYLMTSLDSTNCGFLHELADKYDCPPMKLAAWKLLQKQVPGTENFPSKYQLQRTLLPDGQRRIKGTGLTGPGDPHFSAMGIKRSQVKSHDREASENGEDGEDGEDEERSKSNHLPSVFDDYDERGNRDDDDSYDEDDPYNNYQPVELENLPANASATEVIMAWARRLKSVYTKCVPIDPVDGFDMSRLRLDESAPNLKIKSTPRGESSPMRNTPTPRGEPSPMRNTSTPTASSSVASSAKPKAAAQTSSVNEVASPTSTSAPSSKSILKSSAVPKSPSALKPTMSMQSMTAPPPAQPAGKLYSSAKEINWQEELQRFYTAINMPEKVAGIKSILRTWAGKEDQMIASLLDKYEKITPKPVIARLEQLCTLLEAQTEVSFNVRSK